ncbi:MAG: hypothetical protein MZV49_04235 [Rhodopseudomonas palustris]|nr:hypothetical protein [Rhodopseudomonas palustris]
MRRRTELIFQVESVKQHDNAGQETGPLADAIHRSSGANNPFARRLVIGLLQGE